jgi:hypothetical protein
MRKNRFLYILVFFLISFLVGFDFKCKDKEKDEIKIYITCNGDPIVDNSFSGFYLFNSDAAVSFVGTKISDSLYTYTAIFDDLDSVVFQVTRVDTDNTLTVWLYKDETMLTNFTKSIDASNTTTYKLDFSYSYGQTTPTT